MDLVTELLNIVHFSFDKHMFVDTIRLKFSKFTADN